MNDDIITAARLNHMAGAPSAWETVEELNVPCGIMIPWIAEGTIWGIKVRRAAGEQRYQQVSGGNIRGCLYLADRILPRTPLIITEGEFDALTAWQAGWGIASAVAIGSASHAGIDRRWYGRLLVAPSHSGMYRFRRSGHGRGGTVDGNFRRGAVGTGANGKGHE